jgi:hypothetical protein
MNSEQILCASEVEEFFWEGSNIAVKEGSPVGYEVSSCDDPTDKSYRVVLVLFSNIYWRPAYE